MLKAEMWPVRMSSPILRMAHGTLGSVSHTFTCTRISWGPVSTDFDSRGLGGDLTFCFSNRLSDGASVAG